MATRKTHILKGVIFSTPLLWSASDAFAAAAQADLGFLHTNAVTISLISAFAVILAGILFWVKQLRLEVLQKSQALEKSVQHIKLMGDNLPNVTIFQLTHIENAEFKFTYLSHSCEQILGFDHDRVMADAQFAYDHVYEEDLPILFSAFTESQRALSPVQLELRLLDKDGNLKWLSVSAVPHREETLLIWDGFLQDISVNKHVEDTLVEENRNFQNLFETIEDFLLVCDLNGRLLHTNPSVVNRLGYSRDELNDMSIIELYPNEARDDIYHLMTVMQTELSTSAGMPLQMKAGGVIPVEMNVFQGFWKNQKVIFGVARDVASRQQTESALRESQQMLQLIMDTIPMSVFWKDKDSIYLGCNKTFIRECGLETLEDVVGKTPYDLFAPEHAGDVVERDQDVIRNNHPLFHFTQSHTRPDGSIGWREVSKIPLRDDNGRAVGVLGVWRDVTEQNRAEERLKRTLEDMERFNQLMRGRERRTLELKAEINELLQQLGQTRKYRTTTEDI